MRPSIAWSCFIIVGVICWSLPSLFPIEPAGQVYESYHAARQLTIDHGKEKWGTERLVSWGMPIEVATNWYVIVDSYTSTNVMYHEISMGEYNPYDRKSVYSDSLHHGEITLSTKEFNKYYSWCADVESVEESFNNWNNR